MNDFYLTLPSNSSMNTFPENTKTKFTTLLPNNLILSGDYEVALANITFPSDIEVDLGKLVFKNFNCAIQNQLQVDKVPKTESQSLHLSLLS